MDNLYPYLLLINAIGFVIMLSDKRKAGAKVWRIPEATLLMVAALGGSIGCLLGMRLFHHKTKNPRFSTGIPLILALQLLLAFALWYYL